MMGKSTISMAIVDSKLLVYQKVAAGTWGCGPHLNGCNIYPQLYVYIYYTYIYMEDPHLYEMKYELYIYRLYI